MSEDNSAEVESNGTNVSIKSKALDHTTDMLAVLALAAVSVMGIASNEVIYGIVTIALGKRVSEK